MITVGIFNKENGQMDFMGKFENKKQADEWVERHNFDRNTHVAREIDTSYQDALANCYRLRQNEYGTAEEQLDEIFHGSLTKWKERIKEIKRKYPKP